MGQSLVNTFQVLHFTLLNTRVCLDITSIEKVLPLMALEVIPLSPDYVAGLMNFSGQSIPVIDLAMILGMKRKDCYMLDSPILLCTDGKERLAVIVDSIKGLADVNENELQMRVEFEKKSSPFLGAISMDSELTLLIDINKIFAAYDSPNIKLNFHMESLSNE